jgi:hypothetical protein
MLLELNSVAKIYYMLVVIMKGNYKLGAKPIRLMFTCTTILRHALFQPVSFT